MGGCCASFSGAKLQGRQGGSVRREARMTGFSRRFGENSAVLADPPLHRLANSPHAASEAAARLGKKDSSVGEAHMTPRSTSRPSGAPFWRVAPSWTKSPFGRPKAVPSLACPQPQHARRRLAMATFEAVGGLPDLLCRAFLMIFGHCVLTWDDSSPPAKVRLLLGKCSA